MSKSEREQFRKDLDMDPELYGEYQLHLLIDQTLEHHDELRFRRKLTEVHQDHLTVNGSKGNKPGTTVRSRRPIKKYAFYLLPAIIFIPLAFIFLPREKKLTNDEIFNRYFNSYTQDLLSRSNHLGKGNDALATGVYYYNKALFDKSGIILSEYLKTDSTSTTALFYLGLSQMAVSNYDDAIYNFKKVLGQDFNYYQEHSKWYLALCYLEMNKLPEARQNFKALTLQNSVYTDRASQILKLLSADK